MIDGIAWTQLTCAAALEWLAAVHGGGTAALAYVTYACCQWMSAPGMYSLLMSNVRPGERSGASALNLLVSSGTQAVAAAVTGIAFTRFGYPHVMMVIGAVIFAAAFLLRLLLAGSESSRSSLETEMHTDLGGVV
jgi:predicted MFS family arabinose efflux permease